MATIYLKHRLWWLNYTVNGRRFRIPTGTANKKLAQLKLDDLKLKIFKGEIGAKQSPSKRTTVPVFFSRFRIHMLNSSAIDRHPDLARLNAWQEYFARKGTKYLNSIDANLIDEFCTTVLANNKPKTVKNYISLLKTALNKAVSWNLIENNPIADVKPPKIVKTFHFFSQREVSRLMAEAQEPLKTAIIIFLNTGLRRAELFHLRWRDVDLENSRLRVWPYEGFSPKGKRPRSIPISTILMPVLKSLARDKNEDDFVYRPYRSPHKLYKLFSALLKGLNMPGTLHDLRHTFASHLAMSGTPMPVLKELLGHANISTTMIYAHLSPDIYHREIEKLRF